MRLVLIYLLFCGVLCKAQSVSPQIINSAGGGGQVGSTGVEVYYNIGEPITSTISDGGGNHFITQGFLQPDVVGDFGLTATPFISSNSCADKTDGVIRVVANVSGANASDYFIKYFWSPASLCPNNDCDVLDSLPAGTYSVTVIAEHNSDPALNDTVKIKNIIIAGSNEPCQITIFTGITPNDDGINDFFFITNIDQFPDNSVEIYNRWGQKLFETKNYNNQENYWKGTLNGGTQVAPSGTYFYIIDLGNGSKPVKGWLELTSGK